MKIVRQISIAGSIALVVLSVSYFTSLFAQDDPPPQPQATSVEPEEVRPVPDDAMEVQTRGPIHEGFATPLSTEVPESIKIREKPPESIEEVPPEVKPEGSNVVWMPGYWAWNDEDEKFLWISGFWRDVPPGRVWVSGYWTEADGGHQWVPGFWSNAKQEEVAYLPPPPESIEEGPSVEAPSQDHFWVPGHWQWQDSRYAWGAGYWARRTHPNWIWIPAHYVWCPSGYIFVDGYYDHEVEERGTLFAPIYFTEAVWGRPHHYYYTPTICWSSHVLTNHFWVRPRYYHYYYGDYYADRYVDWGIRPWYLSFAFGRVSYDPIFSYYRWRHHHDHHDHDWDRHVRDRHDYYRRNEGFRPPRTYRDQVQFANRIEDRSVIRDSVIAAPVAQIVNNNINITNNPAINNIVRENFRSSNQFTRIDQTRRREAARQAEQVRSVVQDRKQIETRENLAQIDRSEREPGKKGEDTRVRRAAPRSLNVTSLTQAMQDPATLNRRGARDLPNAKGPDLRSDAGRGAKGSDLTDVQKGRKVSDAIRDAAKSRDLKAVGDAANARGTRDIARDPGDAVKGPDIGSPNVKGRDIVGQGRDATSPGNGDAARDAARDAAKGRAARDRAREGASDAAKARDVGNPPAIGRPPVGEVNPATPSSRDRVGPRNIRETAPAENRGKGKGRDRSDRAELPPAGGGVPPGITGSPAGPTATRPGGAALPGRDDAVRSRAAGAELPGSVGGGPGAVTRQPSAPPAPRQIRPTAPPTTPRATDSRPRVETPQPRAAPRVERPAPAAPSVRETRPIPPGAVERGSGARARARNEEERNKGK